MFFQNLHQRRFRRFIQIRQKKTLVRGQSYSRLKCVADLPKCRFELNVIVIVNSSILDIQSVEPLAIALFIPAHMVFMFVDVDGMRWFE